MRTNRTLPLMCATVLVLQALVAAINLALPQLAASALHPTGGQLVWIVDTYVLAFAALLIPAGALGDRMGRKGVLIAGLLLFAGANLVSAFAPSVGVLLAGRALAGAGAAMAQPATLALLLHHSRPERRPHAIALWTTFLGLGGMVGNLVAGAVLHWAGWPVLFAVFVPVALLLAAGVALAVPRVPRHPAALDPVGATLLTGGLFALLFGIIEGPERGWGDVAVLGGFAAGLLLITAFSAYAFRTANPLLDPRVFRLPTVRAGALGVGAGFLALFGLFYVNAQFLQEVKGYSTLVTGVAIAPLAVGMGLLSRRAVPLTERFGARRMIGAGLGVIAVGMLALSTATATTPYALYAVYLVVVAAGMAACAPALTGGILAGLPADRAGLGSGINSASREIGAALGVAVIGTVLNSHGALDSPAHLNDGLAVGYRVLAGVLIVLAVTVVAMWPAPAKQEPETATV
ncbi:MFS transporter [Actinoplanes sp. LDG1-06]|uniref:MFS transporter n=1 Tax=Paractinoplanes ovalisporus TaxID=2810368 RepID=A0ABS2AWW9_9ACTN|nr:MFS transporter [Actinoplanes ovalisporus]MBM2623659.1 MFS transporter [Actinoplanes ovalisporus]